jgi:hypothetical protein
MAGPRIMAGPWRLIDAASRSGESEMRNTDAAPTETSPWTITEIGWWGNLVHRDRCCLQVRDEELEKGTLVCGKDLSQSMSEDGDRMIHLCDDFAEPARTIGTASDANNVTSAR